jgi:hypothetical protein
MAVEFGLKYLGPMAEEDSIRVRVALLEREIDDLRGDVARDLTEQRRAITVVEGEATAAAKFIKRVMISAGGLALGAIASAIVVIYQAGGRAAEAKAQSESARTELVHKIELVDDGLSELRKSVRLLLEADLPRR